MILLSFLIILIFTWVSENKVVDAFEVDGSFEDLLNNDDYVKQEYLVHVGALRWTECNTGIEKLYDYLDRQDNILSKIIDKVSKKFEEEIEILNV